MLAKLEAINPLLILSIYCGLGLWLHFSREDFPYLRKIDLSEKKIYLTEYNLSILPLTILVSIKNMAIIVIGHILVSIIAFLPLSKLFKQNIPSTIYFNWIPIKLFEWRSLFRKYFWTVIISYSVGIIISFNPFIFPAFVFIWTSLLSSAYNFIEPKEVIEEFSTPDLFIKNKIKINSLFLHLVLLPHYLLYLLFNYHYWYILLILVVLLQMIIVFGIVLKYSQYDYSTSMVYNQLPFSVFLFLTILFFPIGFLLIYKYWKKARYKIENA